jgi:hypothetical protein
MSISGRWTRKVDACTDLAISALRRVCVSMHACMHVCIRRVCVYKGGYVSACMHACMHVCIRRVCVYKGGMCQHACSYIHACMHVYKEVCAYSYIHTCMYVCIRRVCVYIVKMVCGLIRTQMSNTYIHTSWSRAFRHTYRQTDIHA